MTPIRRIGIFGGTFDPPHQGHLIAAQSALEALDLDHILWVPSGVPPHRPNGAQSAGELRLEMVRRAIQGNDRFMAWDGELRRAGPSYTVDTVRELNEKVDGATEWWLLLGMDQFRALSTWKEPEALVAMVRLAIVARDGAAPGGDEALPYETVRMPRIEISSTEIRRRRKNGETIRYLVPDGVRAIVEREKLYV